MKSFATLPNALQKINSMKTTTSNLDQK